MHINFFRSKFVIVSATTIFTALSACSHNEESSKEQIRLLLKSRSEAVKTGDTALFSSILAENSTIYGKNKSGFISSLTPKSSDSVSSEILYDSPKISVSGGNGEIIQAYRVRFKKGESKAELEGEERITVVSENGVWKISGISSLK